MRCRDRASTLRNQKTRRYPFVFPFALMPLRYYRRPVQGSSTMIQRGLVLIVSSGRRFCHAAPMIAPTRSSVAGRPTTRFSKWAKPTVCCMRRIVAMLDPRLQAGRRRSCRSRARRYAQSGSQRLRTRPLLGLDLLSQYQYKDGKWQGQLYDPESGKTYKSQITLRFRRQTADARLHRDADVRPHGGLDAGVHLLGAIS